MQRMQLKIKEDGTLIIPADALCEINLNSGDEVTIYQVNQKLIVSSGSLPESQVLVHQLVEGPIPHAQASGDATPFQISDDVELTADERKSLLKRQPQ